jgi:hypothetical protein
MGVVYKTQDTRLDRLSAALDTGYRSGGWPAAARKGIEALREQREVKTSCLAFYNIG